MTGSEDFEGGMARRTVKTERTAETKLKMSDAWLKRERKKRKKESAGIVSIRFDKMEMQQLPKDSRKNGMNASAYVKSRFQIAQILQFPPISPEHRRLIGATE
jgi:hypothetical protein